MEAPKRITRAILEKQQYLNSVLEKLKNATGILQRGLYDLVLRELADMELTAGNIADSTQNYRLLTGLQPMYERFTARAEGMIGQIVAEASSRIAALNKSYFRETLSMDISDSVFDRIKTHLDLKIGLRNDKIMRGGYLSNAIRENSVLAQLNDIVIRSVTAGQTDHKTFLTDLSNLINGIPKEVVNESGQRSIVQIGAVEKQYQRYVYDLSQQLDRAHGLALADEVNMNYFVFQGSLVDDSRDFCVCHAGKVWSRDEAKEWPTWTPAKGEYPAGYQIQQKDIYKVPSYLNYAGYAPLTDAGGYRCRHSINWISDDLAVKMRPELKKDATQKTDE